MRVYINTFFSIIRRTLRDQQEQKSAKQIKVFLCMENKDILYKGNTRSELSNFDH